MNLHLCTFKTPPSGTVMSEQGDTDCTLKMRNGINEDIIIRKITKTDYEQYKTMINEFRETTFTEEQFTDTLSYLNPHSEIWIIERDDDIISTGTIIYEKKFIHNNSLLGHIEDICVKQKYRKFGLGKIIVKYLMNLAKERGCYKVTLDCNEENSYFYDKCGLERRGIQMSQLCSNY
jgi:glucosamine-phosphate N-acetyltransferase